MGYKQAILSEFQLNENYNIFKIQILHKFYVIIQKNDRFMFQVPDRYPFLPTACTTD